MKKMIKLQKNTSKTNSFRKINFNNAIKYLQEIYSSVHDKINYKTMKYFYLGLLYTSIIENIYFLLFSMNFFNWL